MGLILLCKRCLEIPSSNSLSETQPDVSECINEERSVDRRSYNRQVKQVIFAVMSKPDLILLRQD